MVDADIAEEMIRMEAGANVTSGMVQPLCLGDDVAAQLAKVAPTVASATRAQRCLFELKRMISQLGTESRILRSARLEEMLYEVTLRSSGTSL